MNATLNCICSAPAGSPTFNTRRASSGSNWNASHGRQWMILVPDASTSSTSADPMIAALVNPAPEPSTSSRGKGPGPFISQEEALAAVQEWQIAELLGAQLVSEVEARRQAGACNTFEGHPDGVWLLQVRGTFEGSERTMLFFVDAVTGVQVCGEER